MAKEKTKREKEIEEHIKFHEEITELMREKSTEAAKKYVNKD